MIQSTRFASALLFVVVTISALFGDTEHRLLYIAANAAVIAAVVLAVERTRRSRLELPWLGSPTRSLGSTPSSRIANHDSTE